MGPAADLSGLCQAEIKDLASLPLDPPVGHPGPWSMRLRRGNLQFPGWPAGGPCGYCSPG